MQIKIGLKNTIYVFAVLCYEKKRFFVPHSIQNPIAQVTLLSENASFNRLETYAS